MLKVNSLNLTERAKVKNSKKNRSARTRDITKVTALCSVYFFDLLISPVLPNFMKFSIRSQAENVFMYANFLSQSVQGL